jgi:hypothetical protein
VDLRGERTSAASLIRKAETVRTRFSAIITCIGTIVARPPDNPLFKTRLRNQADFYSLFTAVAESSARGNFNCASDDYTSRLTDSITTVEDEQRRAQSKAATDYFKGARSNSNDSGPRKKRHEIMVRVPENSLNDYIGTDIEQVQVD